MSAIDDLVNEETRSAGSVDVAGILAPIEGETPGGDDLRYDPVYDRIQELRREDDPNIPQGIWETTVKQADWPGVRDEIEAALVHRSKDLQLAAWLVEALLMTEGLPGLADGVDMLAKLSERYWPFAHPMIEDGDLDARLASFYWLEDKLPLRVALMPLTVPGPREERPLTWQDWGVAQRLEPLASSKPSEYNRAIEGGAVSTARFLAAVKATPDAFYEGLLRDLKACQAAIGQLRHTLDELCGREAPSLSRLNKLLDEMTQFIQRTLIERGRLAPAAPARRAAAPPPPVAEAAPSNAPRRKPAMSQLPRDRASIASREEAYELLEMVADYLLRTEPHSPTPYLVKRAALWGSLSFDELMAELIDDNGSRDQIFRLLSVAGRE